MSNLIETVRRLLIPKPKELINGAAVTMQVGANGILEPVPSGGFASVTFDYYTDSQNPEIPYYSILWFTSGVHVGPDASTDLIVAGNPWVDDEWKDFRMRNVYDVIHSSFKNGNPSTVAQRGIASNTYESGTDTTRVVPNNGSLVGGVRNNWNTGDVFIIVSNPIVGETDIHYQTTSNLGGTVSLDSKGVPTVTGVAGLHSFDYFLRDNQPSPAPDSVTATAIVEVL